MYAMASITLNNIRERERIDVIEKAYKKEFGK